MTQLFTTADQTDLSEFPMTVLDQICRDLYASIRDMETVSSRNRPTNPHGATYARRRSARRLIKRIRRSLRGRLTVAANARPKGERW